MTYSPIYTSATNVYAKTGLTSSEVDLSTDANLDNIISDAENEIEILTGRKFTGANSKTEFLSGSKRDMIGYSGNLATTISVSEYPIQSITSLLILNIDGTTNTTLATLSSANITAGTFDTTDYWVDTMEDSISHGLIATNRIRLKNTQWPTGNNNIKVAYTYGYAAVPVPVRNLATCLAGIRAWIRFIGGSYNRLNSYDIPQQGVDKGDFYQRGKQNIDQLTEEANRLLDLIGRRPRTLFLATGQDR